MRKDFYIFRHGTSDQKLGDFMGHQMVSCGIPSDGSEQGLRHRPESRLVGRTF